MIFYASTLCSAYLYRCVMNNYKLSFNNQLKTVKLPSAKLIREWLFYAAKQESINTFTLSYILVDKNTILQMNGQYLNHHYYTDIITFNYSQNNDLQGEIYISLETVAENANRFSVTFTQEFLRVVIHGFLHLCGYDDKTEKQKKLMRAKEDYYLSKWDDKHYTVSRETL